MDDILQKAILDVNKMHEVAMKASEKHVLNKLSKDVRKRYIKEMQDSIGDDTFQVDDELLTEFDLNLDDQEDPTASPDQQLGGEQMPGAEGGAETPLDPDGNVGNDENSGLAPQQPTSEVVDEIAGSWEDGTGGVTIVFNDMSDGDSGENFDSLAANAQNDASQFLSSQDTMNTGKDEIDPTSFEGGDQQLDGNEIDFEDGDPFADDDSLNQNVFDSRILNVSDDILLEYIERSVENNTKIKELEEIVQSFQSIVEKMSTQIENQNSTLLSLKEQNIRLMYKNQALNDVSLSEHQKNNIIKALDKAKTITEAKTIFETVKASKEVSKTNLNTLLNPNVGKKFIAESKKTNQNVIRENKEAEKIPPIMDKLYELWGIK